MFQLGGLDNLMIEGELPNIPMHIAAALLYEPGAGSGGGDLYRRLLELLDRVIQHQMPLLRCRIEQLPWHLDKGWWVEDEHFELSRHVVRVALPAPGNWDEFYRLFGHFHAQPLAHDQPLWQLMLVEQLDGMEGIPVGSFAVFWKIHHAMVDGKSAMRLLRAMHGLGDAGPEAATTVRRRNPPFTDFRAPPWWLKYGRAWWRSIERPLDLAADLARMMPAVLLGGGGEEGAKAPPVPRARFNDAVPGDRVVGHVRLELEALRALERRHGCTINDLALCVVAGALRRYLLHHDQLPVESLVAAMPIDVRQPGKDSEIGTRVVVARVPLHTDTRDIRQRLDGIMAATARGKSLHRKDKGHGHGPKVLDIVDDIHPAAILWLGEWLAGSGLMERMPALVNTVVTNVPGFPEPAWLLGARLVDYLGFGPLAPGVGLFHTVSSTDEVVNISFVSCRKFIGDGAEYRAALAESGAELLGKL